MHPDATLPEVDWRLEGRLVEASNVALRLMADETPSAARAVYKPTAGERPLHDFPAHTLAHREVAAYLVAAAGGWECLPETRWFEGEFGGGSLQRWVGPLEPQEQSLVALLTPEELETRAGDRLWLPIAAFDSDDGPLVLAHVDDERLASVAALDVVLANADRKGSHLVEAGDHVYAIDNGLSFHTEDKLRTVLWGWAGDPLDHVTLDRLRRLVDRREELDEALRGHLDATEIEALHQRTDTLLDADMFPEPPEDRYGLPWPPL